MRQANTAYRQREYLLEQEVTALMTAAARAGRHGARDAALILLAYRHGLRWDQIDLPHGLLHAARHKHGIPSIYPVLGPELRALRRLQRDEPETAYVFVSERKAPLTTDAVRKIVSRAGRQAGIAFPVHPHMLRHATGYKLAHDGRTPGPFSCIWATATSSTPRGTRNWSPPASRISGKTDQT